MTVYSFKVVEVYYYDTNAYVANPEVFTIQEDLFISKELIFNFIKNMKNIVTYKSYAVRDEDDRLKFSHLVNLSDKDIDEIITSLKSTNTAVLTIATEMLGHEYQYLRFTVESKEIKESL